MSASPRVDILLTTINARYAHAAFGLRYLLANLGPLTGRARILELTDQERPTDAAERILAHDPAIVGVGVYAWNAERSRDLVAVLKRVRPDLIIVLGGPEISHETADQPLADLADYVITGEAEKELRRLCERLLSAETPGGAPDAPPPHLIPASPPDLAEIELPYALYDDEDIAHRVIYVETSRGCPYRCAFCLSARDRSVRYFELEPFFAAMTDLLARGARRLKLVDRTFNLDVERCLRILEFFRRHHRPDLFLHLEVVPDHFPPALRAALAAFPAGALQLEIGIQTFNPTVAARIGRPLDPERIVDNLTFLRDQTDAHLHADLIVGLPGEDLASFAAGFDRLVALAPDEIQVGILKRLRGAPLSRPDFAADATFADRPPYEVLQTEAIPFTDLQRLKRFALLWDRVANSGNFQETASGLWQGTSPFVGFSAFTDWLFNREGRVHGLALDRLAAALLTYLTEIRHQPAEETRAALLRDYARSGRTKIPRALSGQPPAPKRQNRPPLPRQARRSRSATAGGSPENG